MLNIHLNPNRNDWPALFKRPSMNVQDLFGTVGEILDEVRRNGDEALRSYTEKFDGVRVSEIRVAESKIRDAESVLGTDLKKAIDIAAKNIKAFHNAQATPDQQVETMPGVKCWRKSVPVEKVGLYIPGGTAPLFSTVLMLAIPAQLAGCSEIVLCTPPDKQGNISPAILYAAGIAGVSTILRVGGAQAIAAMAYGTESVPAVYKIFGPGNQYVTAAKQLVSLDGIAIDMPAGPSEVAIIADDAGRPGFIAADLLSQAEHGKDSQVILFCTSRQMAEAVRAEVGKQLQQLPRRDFAQASLANSRCVVVQDIDIAVEMSNAYAPEHLILATDNAMEIADRIVNAGSVFVGHYTPESAGDYASGTNHTLPTNGSARAYSGVSLDSFLKKITFQQITRDGLELLGDAIETMAKAEDLEAHANAVIIRRTGK